MLQSDRTVYNRYVKTMKMSRPRKDCCYRDCNTNSYSNPERTLFQFPKDETRANKWLEAGAIDQVDSLPRFMCDLHFSRIYMCFSARRKMLLSTATPYVYGAIDEEQDQELVQSTSQDMQDEESLSDDIIEHEMQTEIVYVDNEGHVEEPEQIVEEQSVVIKRTAPLSPRAQPKPKIIKIEKLAGVARSTVVSSSSPNSRNDPLRTTSTPEGLILRKVKLKKVSKPVDGNSEKMVVVKKAVKIEENAATKPLEQMRPSLSPSPAKKTIIINTENAQSCSGITQVPQTITSPTTSSISSSPKTKQNEASVQTHTKVKEKNESIYEFIFKGEEYIQLPKAQYIAEKQELEDLVDQSQQEKNELQKQLDFYKKIVHDLKQTILDLPV